MRKLDSRRTAPDNNPWNKLVLLARLTPPPDCTKLGSVWSKNNPVSDWEETEKGGMEAEFLMKLLSWATEVTPEPGQERHKANANRFWLVVDVLVVDVLR